MARKTGAQGAQLEKKALGAVTKSEGMRMLYEGGYETTDVAEVFDAPYGFAYSVGVKAGYITPTPRAASEGKAKVTTKATKSAKATPAKATKTSATRGRGRPAATPTQAAKRSPEATRSAARRAAAKATPAKGRAKTRT